MMIDNENIIGYSEQYERTYKGFYVDMFLQDFHYFLKQNKGYKLITYSKLTKEKVINIGNNDYLDHLVDIINVLLEQLLLQSKGYIVLLKCDDVKSIHNISKQLHEGNLLLSNVYFDKKKKRYCNIINEMLNIDKINKSQIIKFDLLEIGYNKKFFLKPLLKLDENHNALMDHSFIYSNIDHKKVYDNEDLNQIIITRDIYWDCRKYNNNSISIPYLYYRKEKFYNIRVKIFRYIIGKINDSISKLLKIDFDYINISEKVCELNLYERFVNNEISLKELQDKYYQSLCI